MPNGDTVSDLIRILEQTNLADRPGRLLYSGLGTLCPGRLYMLGDNPGGDPDAESDSPRTHLDRASFFQNAQVFELTSQYVA